MPFFFTLASLYVGVGVGFVLTRTRLPDLYVTLLLFFAFKTIFGLRKCTVAYAECKLRGVSRDEGYLNQLMDGIIDIRNEYCAVFLPLFVATVAVLAYQVAIRVKRPE